MPKGPQGQKRPADVIGAAVMIGRIATGEIQDKKRDPGAEANRKGGLKGGKARAKALSPERRREIAKAAAKSRWKYHRIRFLRRLTAKKKGGVSSAAPLLVPHSGCAAVDHQLPGAFRI